MTDDRKALEQAIGYDPVPLSIRNHPEIRFEYRTASDRDGLVERILAAGFTRPPTREQIAEAIREVYEARDWMEDRHEFAADAVFALIQNGADR